jgi:hypothetical protein
MHIVYSVVARRDGRRYENPRYFGAVNPLATSVEVVGEFQNIVEAYRKAGVNVTTDHAEPPVVRRRRRRNADS